MLSGRNGGGDGDSIKEAAKLSGTAQTSNSSSIKFATRYVFRRLLERDGVVLRRQVGKIECMKKGENAKGLMVVCGASGARDVHQPFPPPPGSVSPCSLSFATTDEQLEIFYGEENSGMSMAPSFQFLLVLVMIVPGQKRQEE